jgi:hypothetical protein
MRTGVSRREDDVAHILASLSFAAIAMLTLSLIAVTLLQSRVAIAAALGIRTMPHMRRHPAPVRVKVRRTATWSAPRTAEARRAA